MRGIWFVAGTAAGVYATAKARRAAEALTIDGIHDRFTGWFAGARVLADELRTGTAEKETELRTRLSLVPDGHVRQVTDGRHLELTRTHSDRHDTDHDTTPKDDD